MVCGIWARVGSSPKPESEALIAEAVSRVLELGRLPLPFLRASHRQVIKRFELGFCCSHDVLELLGCFTAVLELVLIKTLNRSVF